MKNPKQIKLVNINGVPVPSIGAAPCGTRYNFYEDCRHSVAIFKVRCTLNLYRILEKKILP